MDFATAMVLAGMISFVPPTIVLYLALSPALSKQERRYTAWSFAIILILETILYLYFFHIGIFKMEWLSFKKMLLTYWPPLLLATFIISQPYFYQNLFVAGMEGLYISFLHTTCMSVTMVFITKGEFLDYCVLYLFAYSLVYVISAPLLLKFFRDLFFKYRTFSMLVFWKYAAWIPILISTYSAVLALRPGPLPEDNMISRVFQALSGIFMAVIMYTGTRQMSHQVHTQQKSHLLGAQMKALSDYTGLLQEMQKRMSIFRHDSRHQLRLLSELIQQGDDEAALTFLDTLHTELQETQLQKWTKNKFINTAVSPGLERMRRAGFDVTVSLPLPQSLPFEIDWGQSHPDFRTGPRKAARRSPHFLYGQPPNARQPDYHRQTLDCRRRCCRGYRLPAVRAVWPDCPGPQCFFYSLRRILPLRPERTQGQPVLDHSLF